MNGKTFVKAIYEMLETGEFEKTEKYLRRIEDPEQADFVKGLAEALRNEPHRVPFLPLLVGCDSAAILQGAIVAMLKIDQQEREKNNDAD